MYTTDEDKEKVYECNHCGEPIVQNSREHDESVLDYKNNLFCGDCHEYCLEEEPEEDLAEEEEKCTTCDKKLDAPVGFRVRSRNASRYDM